MKTDVCWRPEKYAEERDHLKTFYLALKVPIYKMGSFLLQRSWPFQGTKLVKLYYKAKKKTHFFSLGIAFPRNVSKQGIMIFPVTGEWLEDQ